MENWPALTGDDSNIPCPITFSEDEVKDISRLYAEQMEAEDQYQACLDAFGAGAEG